MRADAQRNYDRLVEVATEIFTEQGTDASLDEVAKRAEVGPGTLYRHFPTRESLINAAMTHWVERIQRAAAEAVVSDGPPRALLLGWFEDFVAHISQYRGGAARLTAALDNPDSPIYGKGQVLAEANAKVLDRLVAHGALREGVDTIQVCRLVGGVAVVADVGELGAAATRPLLEIVPDGLLCCAEPRVPSI